MIENKNIDGGKPFDWGKTSLTYAKYRDIYPEELYQFLIDQDICTSGQTVLDIGTGTGVLPRNLYRFGARFTGIDISENQIAQAKILARQSGMNIDFFCSPAEKMHFPEQTFDTVTACQCFTYFDHALLAPYICRILKSGGRFVILYMAWLPNEDEVAGQSENLVLKYNPGWTGCGETRHAIQIPESYTPFFELEKSEVFDVDVPFNRETWNGRMKSCRGIEASLSEEETAQFEQEHKKLLAEIAPEEFKVKHYIAATVLRKK